MYGFSVYIFSEVFSESKYSLQTVVACQYKRCRQNWQQWQQLQQQQEFTTLKVVSATFLLVCFVSVQEGTGETRKNIFYFT